MSKHVNKGGGGLGVAGVVFALLLIAAAVYVWVTTGK